MQGVMSGWLPWQKLGVPSWPMDGRDGRCFDGMMTTGWYDRGGRTHVMLIRGWRDGWPPREGA
eukprot:scaffold1102_cov195-Alexandrium_tamarense.AAC.21